MISLKTVEVCTDVLVIGGGLAGIRSALAARKTGVDVILVTKDLLGIGGCSSLAGGVFAAVMPSNSSDSPQAYFQDTMSGGRMLNNPQLVHELSHRSAGNIQELIDLGVEFLSHDSQIKLLKVPGHSQPRLVSCRGGGTKQLMTVLAAAVFDAGIRVMPRIMITDLAVEETSTKKIAGAIGIDFTKDTVVKFEAKAVVLAAGGGGHLYPFTTNPPDMTGDGFALAYRAGAEMINPEFIQFTPTALLLPQSLKGSSTGGMLLAQPGVQILNSQGERFMERYDPQAKEAATRDILSRAMYREIIEGRGSPEGGVYLDLSGLPQEFMGETMGPLAVKLADAGIDWRQEYLQIAPAAHTLMGGVRIDRGCQTNIPGLFAAGENSGGLHGANRLIGNALTEASIFGNIAGEMAGLWARERAGKSPDRVYDVPIAKLQNTLAGQEDRDGGEQAGLTKLKKRLQDLMWRSAGVERSADRILQGISGLKQIEIEMSGISCSNFLELKNFFELENMIMTARMVLNGALAREESRGAHYRIDFPGLGEVYQTLLYQAQGELRLVKLK